MVADNNGFSSELHNLTLYKLIAAYQRVLNRFEINQLKHSVVQYPYTIEEQIDYISALIKNKKRVSFIDLFLELINHI